MKHQTLFFYGILAITVTMGTLWHFGLIAPTVVCGGDSPEFWQRPNPYPPCEEEFYDLL